jgi:hypothetical protein
MHRIVIMVRSVNDFLHLTERYERLKGSLSRGAISLGAFRPPCRATEARESATMRLNNVTAFD